MNEPSRQFTLLLVDDNPTNLMLLAKIIELDLPQVRVLTASTGMAGLQLAAQEQIDGAFIDVQMPEMSGLEMCRRLKADPRTAGMPLVLITAHLASPEMRAEGLEVGAYDFISQPISNVEMLARIKVMLRLCEGERTRQETPSTLEGEKENSAQLRLLNGLFISAGRDQGEIAQKLLRELAGELATEDEPDELRLAALLATRFPLPWRRTFLKLALLEKVPLALAGRLSEIGDVEAVCHYLQRHNLLLESPESGSESLRFKASVHERLKKELVQLLDQSEQQQLFQLAGDWYQQKGDFLGAFCCLLQGQQYQSLSQLLSYAGLELFAEPYLSDILPLLARIPEAEAVRCGWLALYTGTSYMLSQPLEVDTWLELARSRFVTSGDQRGELLAVTQQLIQYLVIDGQIELGEVRLQRLQELAETQLEFLNPFNRLKVQFAWALGELVYLGDLDSCEDLLASALSEAMREKLGGVQMNFSLLQVLLGLYQGRFRVARASMEQAKLTARSLPEYSFPVLASCMVECELLYSIGELDAFSRQQHILAKLFGGQAYQQTAFYPLLNIFTALRDLASGNDSVAEELLEVTLLESPAARRPHLRSWLLQLRALLHAQAGRSEEARQLCEQALELREVVDIGLHRLLNQLLAGATYVLLQDLPAAEQHLQAGLATSVAFGEERYRGGFHAWLAAAHCAGGGNGEALEQLELLFDLLRRQNSDFFFALTPELLRQLLPQARTRPEWMAQLQRLCDRWLGSGLTPDGRLLPLAQVQTLGGFNFRLGDKSCDLSEVGQASRQLLALLTVAPNFCMNTEALMGSLWPDSSPSKARNSFDTALSRLRKALEKEFGKQIREDYLLLGKGLLQLRCLRVDSKQFGQALEDFRRHLQRQNLWQAEQSLWQAEACWQGEFLAGFELEADLPYRREHFSQLWLELLAGLANLLQQRGDFTQALRLLLLGLQSEPTNDLLIQHLLDIYQQQGEKRAVRQLLDNYRKALQDEEYDQEEIDELIATLGPQRLEI